MTQIIFRKNNIQKTNTILLSLITVIILCGLILYGIKDSSLLLIISSSLFLVIAIYQLFKAIINAPTVIINEDGINSKVNGMGLIRWDLIERFEIKKPAKTPMLVIIINDEKKLFEGINKLSTLIMKSNIKKLGSPVVIPESEFNEPLEIVIDKIEVFRNSSIHII